ISVLPGQGAPVGRHQAGRLLYEGPVAGDPCVGAQLERDAGVHAAMPEVPIEGGALVAVRREQALEVAQVLAEPLRRHRRVLPALVRLVLPRWISGGAESLLPHVPEAVLGRRVVEVG